MRTNLTHTHFQRIVVLVTAVLLINIPDVTAQNDNRIENTPTQVTTGLEHLIEMNFEPIKGKRVGLITNATGVDATLRSTIDILHESPEVDLVALYGPEHGVRGDYAAGDKVESYTDPSTGIPVFSLYGATRKPNPEMLNQVEVLVYDIQDIGVRSYTYISTMGLAMETAAELDIPFVVLDRPNPLGGLKVEGALGASTSKATTKTSRSLSWS